MSSDRLGLNYGTHRRATSLQAMLKLQGIGFPANNDNSSHATSQRLAAVKQKDGLFKGSGNDCFNHEMFRLEHVVQPPLKSDKRLIVNAEIRGLHSRSKISAGGVDRETQGVKSPHIGSSLIMPSLCHFRKKSHAVSEAFQSKITQEEKADSLKPLIKLRTKLADTTDKFPCILKRMVSSILVSSMNQSLASKTSIIEYFGEISRTITEFCTESMAYENNLADMISKFKEKEKKVLKQAEKFDKHKLTMNSLALELDIAHMTMEDFVRSDINNDELQAQNRKLQDELLRIRGEYETKMTSKEELHDIEMQRIKNSFYIVQKLQDSLNKKEETIHQLQRNVEELKQRVYQLEAEMEIAERRELKQLNQLMMFHEDLKFRTKEALSLRDEVKSIKNGIVGILFNREQRDMKDKGTQNTIMARSQMIKDYIRQYEDQLQDNIYTYSILKNAAFDTIPFNKFKHIVDYVSSQVNIYGNLRISNHGKTAKKYDFVQNIILEKTKLKQRNIGFADYKMAGPSFANLVHRDLFEMSMTDIEQVFTKGLDILDVLETIRAIFDSYYIELQSHAKLDNCLEFGSFVYLWLERFELEQVTRDIIGSNSEQDKMKRKRSEFAVKITSPVFQKLWDSYMFNEFLAGRFTKDDIFFYLNARGLILFGLEGDTRGRKFDITQLVPYTHVLQGLSLFLHSNSTGDLEDFLVFQLVSSLSRTKKNGIEYLDLYQVLRICLEEYRYLKISKYMTFFDTVQDSIRKSDSAEKAFSFGLFSSIVVAVYPSMTSSDILILYRRCLSIGRGAINLECLWVAGEESGFYACLDRFGTYSKKDVIKRATIDGKGKIHMLQKFFTSEESDMQDAIKRNPIIHNVDHLDAYESLDITIRRWTQGKVSDETNDRRIRIMKLANSLGSINFTESYEKVLMTFNDTLPKSLKFCMTSPRYFSHVFELETSIISMKENIMGAMFNSPMQQFKMIEALVEGRHGDFNRLDAIEANRQKFENLRRDRARQIQRNALAVMDGWYKMVVLFLKKKIAQDKASLPVKKVMDNFSLGVDKQGGSSRNIKQGSDSKRNSIIGKRPSKQLLALPKESITNISSSRSIKTTLKK